MVQFVTQEAKRDGSACACATVISEATSSLRPFKTHVYSPMTPQKPLFLIYSLLVLPAFLGFWIYTEKGGEKKCLSLSVI